MSNALTLFDKPDLAIPAHLQDVNDDANIVPRVSVNALGMEGKTWSITLNGDKTPLMKRDADGDEIPVSVMQAIILEYNKRRGRSYYPGAYDPAKVAQPACWSEDGVAPHDSIAEPVCKTCADCPMAAKGSKVSEQGKAVTACSQHRVMVVVPAFKPDMEPLRFKIPVTSDYDRDGDTPGWFAFQQYLDLLTQQKVRNTAMLITKMKFDATVAYPKVLFSPFRWLTPEEKTVVIPASKSEATKKLLAGAFDPAGIAPAKDDDDGEVIMGSTKAGTEEQALIAAEAKRVAEERAAAEAKAAAKAAKEAKAKAAAEAKAKAAAEAEAKAAAAAKPVTGFIVDDDDDDDETPTKPTEPAASKPTETATSGVVTADVAALLDDWDD